MIPVLHQIEGVAVYCYGLKPSCLSLFFDTSTVVMGLALRDTELGLTVVIVGALSCCLDP